MPIPSRNGQWSIEKASRWAKATPWLIGCNYLPRTAINQLECFQADTFDPDTIEQELSWAAGLGFNSLRVFLHDLLWQVEGREHLARLERFLGIAAGYGIGVMFVLFDSCWHPFPHYGLQPLGEPGVHNPGWVQSPSVAVLREPARFDALESYVTGIVSHFRDDPRVQVWDIWNEPGNYNINSYAPRDLGPEKMQVVLGPMEKAFAWARSARPSQPLTSGIWTGDWSSYDAMNPLTRAQAELSDVISFHCYNPADGMRGCINALRPFGRPLLCTEYMARGTGSRFETILPLLKEQNVGAYNWGFVAGKSQTCYGWDSWQNPCPSEPLLWFHDILRPDGQPYSQQEVACIRKLTGRE